MGLDMYLHAKKYLSQFDAEGKALSDVIVAESPKGMGKMQPRYLVCEAIYWRKANHIHQWFVNKVQKGVDDCGDYEVSTEQLKELRDLCQLVIDNKGDPAKIRAALPTAEGFFFGSTDYDAWYFDETQRTIESIDALLSVDGIDGWWFEYHSSW